MKSQSLSSPIGCKKDSEHNGEYASKEVLFFLPIRSAKAVNIFPNPSQGIYKQEVAMFPEICDVQDPQAPEDIPSPEHEDSISQREFTTANIMTRILERIHVRFSAPASSRSQFFLLLQLQMEF